METQNPESTLSNAPGDSPEIICLKAPKRILLFSDGTMEDFGDDETDQPIASGVLHEESVDESKLLWGPWMLHRAVQTGGTLLAGCDYLGEALANFLGITSPKFAAEIGQYERNKKELSETNEECYGWSVKAEREPQDGACDKNLQKF